MVGVYGVCVCLCVWWAWVSGDNIDAYIYRYSTLVFYAWIGDFTSLANQIN